jgi:hypothetical protein
MVGAFAAILGPTPPFYGVGSVLLTERLEMSAFSEPVRNTVQ